MAFALCVLRQNSREPNLLLIGAGSQWLRPRVFGGGHVVSQAADVQRSWAKLRGWYVERKDLSSRREDGRRGTVALSPVVYLAEDMGAIVCQIRLVLRSLNAAHWRTEGKPSPSVPQYHHPGNLLRLCPLVQGPQPCVHAVLLTCPDFLQPHRVAP